MIIVKVWEKGKYLCSFKVENFIDIKYWVINHLDMSIYEANGYFFEAHF
jgi:hypothetical protein